MRAIDKAIWYIENHYREAISLDALAMAVGVSKYHLSRIFCYAVGQPMSRYIRRRRLSMAAIALAAGEQDILNLALSIGYGSHEAFSRAFKQHFCHTPEQIRKQGHTRNLTLTEARPMAQNIQIELEPPRQAQLGPLRIAGLSRHYQFDQVAQIPDQWQSFAPLMPQASQQPNPKTYGVIFHATDDGFDYLSGVELTQELTSNHLVQLDLKPQKYLVFWHAGHVSSLHATCHVIWSEWLPASSYAPLEAPWFERYGDSFDPVSGNGGLEIWIPVGASK